MARILVMDDDVNILALVKLILTDEGHEILTVDSARAGLDLLRIYQVDLAIVDIMMPELTGFQFVNLVKNNPRLQEFPIAFMTAKTDRQDVLKAGELGASLYLTKPVSREVLIEKTNELFKKHPPRDYPRVALRKFSSAEARIHRSVQILAISDLCIEILSDEPWEEDQIVELASPLFQEMPLKTITTRVLSVKKTSENGWRAVMMLLDPDIETVRKIQKWISYKRAKL